MTSAAPYDSIAEHYADELGLLNERIQLRVSQLRQGGLPCPTGQQLYVSDDAVDHLLSQLARTPSGGRQNIDFARINEQREHINRRLRATVQSGWSAPLARLAELFRLTAFDIDAVMICLAPELDRRYDRLFIYLQDDITRRRPSVDLVLDLLCPSMESRWLARVSLTHGGPLLRRQILRQHDDPQSPSGSSGLAKFLAVDERILSFLLGDDQIDPELGGLLSPLSVDPLLGEQPETDRVARLVRQLSARSAGGPLVVTVHGNEAIGQADVLGCACAETGIRLVRLDTPLFLLRAATDPELPARLVKECILRQTVLLLDQADPLFDQQSPTAATFRALLPEVGRLTLAAATAAWPAETRVPGSLHVAIELGSIAHPLRVKLWRRVLEEQSLPTDESLLHRLASRTGVPPAGMRAAVAQAALASESAALLPNLEDRLVQACRDQSAREVRGFVQRIQPCHGWQDIILPESRMAQLREIGDQIRFRHRVLTEWGFEAQLAYGTGLSILFTGPPGTGKTLAAEIVAHDAGMDLFRINLSTLVSKYIGETEKNLDCVFSQAERADAILFFDEADALFGRRTQVADAHDRYANLETGYLLQRVEAFRGTAILATNLRENLDEAFIRRVRVIVDFPFPDAEQRAQIWRRQIPAQAPIDPDIDFMEIARKYPIAGGSIKNAALSSAFRAAADGGRISVEHLSHGVMREYEKIGKRWHPIVPSESKPVAKVS